MEQLGSNSHELWDFLRKREALMTTPAYSTAASSSLYVCHPAGRASADRASWHCTPPEVQANWDPQATWLHPPATPALPAAGSLPQPLPATILTAPHPATPASQAAAGSGRGMLRQGLTSIWRKLKGKLGRAAKKGGKTGGSSKPWGSPSPPCGSTATPCNVGPASGMQRPSPPTATTSRPLGLLPDTAPPARPTRGTRPPLPPPAPGPGRHTATPAGFPGSASSTHGTHSRLLQPGARSSGATSSAADSEAAPHWQQRQERFVASSDVAAAVPDGTDLFDASPEEEDATARRLVFSPGRSTALPIPAVRRQSQQGQQAPQAQQVPTGGEAEPGLGAAELEVAPAWLQGRRQAAAGALQPPRSCSGTFLALHGGNGGALVAPRLSCDVLRASDAALPGASSGVASLADASLAPQLERVLWVPPALLGTWQRDDGASLDAGGLAGVHALLRMPPLQAAAWEQTRELQISDWGGKLLLAWTTQLLNGSQIRRPPEAYPAAGALATVPRLDGRPGTAAAQLAVAIDGSLNIKAVQGPPLPAMIQRKLRLSAHGSRLRVSLKVLLLEQEGTWLPSGGASRGGDSAKQVTYWRRVA